MGISKAFLTRLDQLVRDPGARLAIREFLLKFGPEMNQRKIRIIDDRLYYSGTIDILTFYELHGEFRTRMKSSLTRERFLKDLCFEASRKSAQRFAQGNQLASKLYGMVEEEKKVYSLFCFLKKKAIGLIKEGKSAAEAEEILKDYLRNFGFVNEKKCIDIRADRSCTSPTSQTSESFRAHMFHHAQLSSRRALNGGPTGGVDFAEQLIPIREAILLFNHDSIEKAFEKSESVAKRL